MSMHTPKMSIKEYDEALRIYAHEVYGGIVSLHPLLGDIQKHPTEHVGPTRNIAGSQLIDREMFAAGHTITIHADLVRNSELDNYVGLVFDMAKSFEDQMLGELFTVLTEVIEAVGTVVRADGAPPSYDHILEMLDKLDLSFDDESQPILPTFFVNSKTARVLETIKPTREQLKKQNEILVRKQNEYLAAKRTRRLS